MEPREKAALLPDAPGVYLFRDAGGTVLYVGKAASLRSRVRSYFLESSWVNSKTGSLAREIADLETIVVDNERGGPARDTKAGPLSFGPLCPRWFPPPHFAFPPQTLSRPILPRRPLPQPSPPLLA